MKKVFSLVFAFMIVMSGSISALAVNQSQTSVMNEDWGNGITAVVTTTVDDSSTATRAEWTPKTVHRTWTIYKSDVEIGSVTLNVIFSYNGTSSKVAAYSSSHTTASGWSYGNESISVSGGKCTISGKFTGSGSLTFTKSVSCSPTGVIY